MVPGEVAVNVSQDLHEIWVDRGQTNTGSLSHVDGALLRQVHVVEVDELKLGLLLWPEWNLKMSHLCSEQIWKSGPTMSR